MKKSVALLSIAACAGAGAVSLRGEGVEEVGEQVENFPPEDYGLMVDRRILHVDEVRGEEDETGAMAGRLMEEYFEGGEGFGEEEEVVDLADFDADAVDIMGNVVEHDEELEWRYFDEGEEPPVGKEHSPDPDTITLEGNGLLGEVVEFDQYDRREASCGANQGEVKLIMRTDNYGYETAWKIVNQNNGKTIARGPPRGTNYADKSTYSGRWCLPPGRYRAVVEDRGRDGMCTGNPQIFGCGFFKVYLNGNPAGQIVNDKSRWVNKGFPINVAPVASRIDGVGTQPQGEQWCRKVRSVMKVPQGTCTTPDGRRGHRVRVLTKVDKYGKETQWTIKRNGVTKMKMGPVIEANKQLSVQECLAPGTYEVKFTDMDGICCRHGEGFFKVFVDGKELITGGSFTSSISHDLRLGFDWISNMSERDCEWWWAHDYRRRDWHTRCYEGKYCDKTYRHLKWNPQLKRDAQVYANTLLDSCDSTGILHDKTDQGENLAKNKGTGPWGQLYPADKVTKRFVDNEEFWGWNKNAHLTQSIWYPTRYIGCAESAKNMGGGKMCRMQVCRYAKAGNCMMGKYSSDNGNNWMVPMMKDDSPCGPMCPPGGCHN